jgi:dephospho-CoA kinase
MLKIGLTGGIGSGKSTIAKVFETLGIPVYYADDAAKRLMNEDPHLKTAIIQQFGPEAYTDGKLNRSWLGERVFGNEANVQFLNSLVHPATIRDASRWMSNLKAPYALKEAALIFESGGEKELDFVIGVYTPLETRIQRVMQRDQTDRASILKRIEAQMPEEEKMKRCDFIIRNDDTESVIQQVLSLHQQLLDRSAHKTAHG